MATPKIYIDSCCFIEVAQEQLGVTQSSEDNRWFTKRLVDAAKAGESTPPAKTAQPFPGEGGAIAGLAVFLVLSGGAGASGSSRLSGRCHLL